MRETSNFDRCIQPGADWRLEASLRYPKAKELSGVEGLPLMGTIVLADDDDDLRAVYAPFLRSLGHEVWEAPGGEEALALVREHRPELLILDVWMPHCNGFEVLEQLRHDPLTARMKTVMLSNLGDADTRLECFEMGASEYLVKGLALADFRGHVARLLADTTEVRPEAPTAT